MSRPLEARFYDPERKRWNIYNFEIVGLDHTIAQDLKSAFVDLVGHYHPRSRIQAWRSTRLLCSCIVERNISFGDDCKDILAGYALFLDSGKRLKKTIGSHYNFARRLVDWLSEFSESIFWRHQIIQLFDFSRERKSNRDNDISYNSLQRIVSVCKKEIADLTKSFAVSCAIEKGETVSHPDLTAEDIGVISALISAAKENAWTQGEIRAKFGRTINIVSLKRFQHYRELTYRTALPIYILLLVEMAANPIALMEIELDCYDSDPTDETQAFIRWEKGRSGREQQLSFLKAGKYSAPSLIELVISLTETTRCLAQSGDERILFLIRTGHVARRFSVQSLHNHLSEFRELHGFPHFNFSDLRKAVAALIKNKKHQRMPRIIYSIKI